MDIEEFARLEVAQGAPVHFHDGIWWQRIKPFYSWPLQTLKAFPRGTQRPSLLYSAIGYEHAVPDEREANAILPMMLLQDISEYDLKCLSAAKRNQIRQGLKQVEGRRLEDIRDLVEQGLEINRSALTRQGWGGNRRGYLNEPLWRRVIERAHALGARESWGVYFRGKLVAYLRAYVLDETVCITQTMSHSDYLGYRPNDALLHTFLMDCKARPGTKRVLFGLECAKPSLNEYKRKFGFEVVKLPVYRRLNPVVRYLARFTRYRHYVKG
jgi:hypothetical protein